jgi:hypothetical protein
VCLVIQAVGDARPEVRDHLVAAGRELVLALHAALKPAEPADAPRQRTDAARLRRIDIR